MMPDNLGQLVLRDRSCISGRRPLVCLILLFLFLSVCLPVSAQNNTPENDSDSETDTVLTQKVIVTDGLKQQLKQKSVFEVVVLPMQNMSVDPEVAYFFRQRIIERLHAKGYSVVNTQVIDKKLYEIGVSHAEQIGLLHFEQIRELVEADGYLFGIVEQAASQHAVAYNAYVYTSSLKMQAPDGSLQWAALEERAAKRRFALDPINALLDIFLVQAGGDKKEAVYYLADKLLESLPSGPVNVQIGDSLLEEASEVKAIPANKENIP